MLASPLAGVSPNEKPARLIKLQRKSQANSKWATGIHTQIAQAQYMPDFCKADYFVQTGPFIPNCGSSAVES